MNKKLVILSVPHARLSRVLLGTPVLETIREKCDVLIISPNVEQTNFQTEFGHASTSFFKWEAAAKMQFLERCLSIVANIQRVNGYWFRHRNKGMGMRYYHRNAIYVTLADGNTKKMPLIKAVLYRAIAITGYFRFSWRITDAILGYLFRTKANLDRVVKDYHDVILIQSCTWGEQDIYLSWYARQKKIRTIFISYTTDQLYCNGYLLSDYAAVCIQGEFEKNCATLLHYLPAKRQKQLGSAWFRHFDVILDAVDKGKKTQHDMGVRYILFSGHGHQYFSRESESIALVYLDNAVTQGLLGNVKIIYRPVAVTLDEIKTIKRDWGHSNNIEIQFLELGIIGLQHQQVVNFTQDWRTYVENIYKVDVLVMTFITSLALDVGYLGKPVICLFDDPSGGLAKKRTDLMFDSMGKIPGLEELQVVYKVENLIPILQQALKCTDTTYSIKKHVSLAWDYPKVNFKHTLNEILHYSSTDVN